MTLSEDMLKAADVLAAVSGLYNASCPDRYPWTAIELRTEARFVEAEGK